MTFPALSILAEGESIPQIFGLNWPAFIAQTLAFCIVLFVLKTYAFQPIIDVLEERRRRIAEGQANAERIKHAARRIRSPAPRNARPGQRAGPEAHQRGAPEQRRPRLSAARRKPSPKPSASSPAPARRRRWNTTACSARSSASLAGWSSKPPPKSPARCSPRKISNASARKPPARLR